MILIGRGLDFRSIEQKRKRKQRSGDQLSGMRKKKGQSLRESFDVQLSGCARAEQTSKALNQIAAISGGNDERVPPVPIPNTAVKPLSANGTWLDTARESRSPPDSIEEVTRLPLFRAFDTFSEAVL